MRRYDPEPVYENDGRMFTGQIIMPLKACALSSAGAFRAGAAKIVYI